MTFLVSPSILNRLFFRTVDGNTNSSVIIERPMHTVMHTSSQRCNSLFVLVFSAIVWAYRKELSKQSDAYVLTSGINTDFQRFHILGIHYKKSTNCAITTMARRRYGAAPSHTIISYEHDDHLLFTKSQSLYVHAELVDHGPCKLGL